MAFKDFKITKNMTIEQLAEMVRLGFDAVDKRFESLESNVNTKFEDLWTNMNLRFDRVESRLANTAYRFEVEELDRRLNQVEHRLNLK